MGKKAKQKKKDDDDEYVPGGGKRKKKKPKGARGGGRSKVKSSVKSEVKVKSEIKEGSSMKNEVSDMIDDIYISGSDRSSPANQGKKESSDVDELPEISDDDFEPPASKIAILANEIEQKTFISGPPILEEGHS